MNKHQTLYSKIENAPEYWPIEERKEVLDLITELNKDNNKLQKKLDKSGKYGIRYINWHDDATIPKTEEIFFSSEKRRDEVYKQWEDGKYFDDVFKDYLQYPQPATVPNFHIDCKIFKHNEKVYEE